MKKTITKKATTKKYDAEYISYVESGESAAVFITRDICKKINTKGKWIDVIDLDTFLKDNGSRTAFNYFIVEIFDRKIKPEYPKYRNKEDIKYITWKTAHEDISEQRARGIKGAKYLVLSELVHKKRSRIQDDWKYNILGVKKVTDKQIRHIKKHKERIGYKILRNGKPLLKFFGLT